MNPVEAAVAQMKAGRWLLAVSGGRDSMVLLDAMWRARRKEIVAVTTFDHGTGPHARKAADHVEHECARLELQCVRGEGKLSGKPTEEALRKSRWDFLNKTADKLNARVVTAHTLDDHAETTFIRILRDAHARGIAGMLVPSAIERPLMLVKRADIATYAKKNDVTWVEDPTNASNEYLRNRVRNEILPTMEKLRPGFTQWLLVTSARGAVWRRGLSDAVDHMTRGCQPGTIPVTAMEGMTPEAQGIVWPEVASRVGVTLDWRGIERLSKEARKLKQGAEIPLSGGASFTRTVTTFVFRNPRGGGPLY
jgi:tRNA(Ile)-lysidine synthase